MKGPTVSDFLPDKHPYTTWMRRYTLVPELAEEFIQFLIHEVFPARREFGFEPLHVWVDADRSHVTWLVGAALDSQDFARLEENWENSEIRADVFDGKPAYVVAKDLREVQSVPIGPEI